MSSNETAGGSGDSGQLSLASKVHLAEVPSRTTNGLAGGGADTAPQATAGGPTGEEAAMEGDTWGARKAGEKR